MHLVLNPCIADEADHEDAAGLILSYQGEPGRPEFQVGDMLGNPACASAKNRELWTQAGGMNLTLSAIRRYSGDPGRCKACCQYAAPTLTPAHPRV